MSAKLALKFKSKRKKDRRSQNNTMLKLEKASKTFL